MARTITIEIPHSLTVEKAMQRVRRKAQKLEEEFRNRVQGVEQSWTATGGTVTVRVLGQKALATIDASDGPVRLTVELPLLLSPFSGKVEAYLTREGTKLLSGREARQKLQG